MMARNEMKLKFEGDFGKTVPASMLISALNGIQHSIYLLAMERDGIPARQKERTSNQIESRYQIFCSIPRAGSFEQTINIGIDENDLFGGVIEKLLTLWNEIILHLQNGNSDVLKNNFLTKPRREKFLEYIKEAMPKEGSGVNLKLYYNEVEIVKDSKKLAYVLKEEKIKEKQINEEIIHTITGKLSEIDFITRELKLIYPVNDRELKCNYSEDLEELLLKHPRDYIQVTGKVVWDENDFPTKIGDVERIDELDLSPYYVSSFSYEEYDLKFKNRKEFIPFLDETCQLIQLEDKELGIHVFAFTRDELDEELKEELEMLWLNYAKQEDGNLTEKAITLKQNLLTTIEEVIHAKG